jgi:hypothetical protein
MTLGWGYEVADTAGREILRCVSRGCEAQLRACCMSRLRGRWRRYIDGSIVTAMCRVQTSFAPDVRGGEEKGKT